MASKYTHDVVATTGEYTNAQGEKKKEYTNVGKAFTDDQGRISIKMKSIPVGPEWSGWLSLYPRKDDDRREPQGARSPEYGRPDRRADQNGAAPPARDNGGKDYPDDADAIPFKMADSLLPF